MAENIQFEKPEVFAVKHQDDSERMLSQSGGMFALLSDYILENGGIIYGCAFDESFKAVHMRACDKESRDLMRGSKYVQSDMGDVFAGVLADLKAGRTVLFSGASCQVAGLRSFLKTSSLENTDNLFTADIVCHGVPSPLVWRDYLAWEAGRKGSCVTPLAFTPVPSQRRIGVNEAAATGTIETIDAIETIETIEVIIEERAFKGIGLFEHTVHYVNGELGVGRALAREIDTEVLLVVERELGVGVGGALDVDDVIEREAFGFADLLSEAATGIGDAGAGVLLVHLGDDDVDFTVYGANLEAAGRGHIPLAAELEDLIVVFFGNLHGESEK